jgi:hypothetical protein
MKMPSTLEDEFVFRLLQRIGNPDESDFRLEIIGNADPDWNVILNLVSQHRLHSVLRQAIADTAVNPPKRIAQMLDDRYRENSIRNLEYSRQLYELSDLFESNGIAAIPYKGPVLAEVAYGNVGDRSFGDLDFLVAKGDVKAACDLLERNGYKLMNFADIPVDTLIDETVFRWGKEFRFIDSDSNLPVELRFGFIGGKRSEPEIFADLWKRRTATTLVGRTVPALSPEDRALLLLVHGTKHGWRQLSWIYDIALILQQDVDWETVIVRAKKYCWRNAVLYGLGVTAAATGLSVPESIQAELDSTRLCSWGARQTVALLRDNLGENVQYLEPITIAMFLNDDLPGAFAEGIHEVLAPRKADYDWIPLPQRLYLLYYVVRPCRLAINKFKQVTTRLCTLEN